MSLRNKLLDEINSEIENKSDLIESKKISKSLIIQASEQLVDSFLGLNRSQFANEKKAVDNFISSLEKITSKNK